jgi:hypothetical protein
MSLRSRNEHRKRKATLRKFMRDHYSDERLSWLLEYARSGELRFYSCCCFIGIPTANHALQSGVAHLKAAYELDGADEAETAFKKIYKPTTIPYSRDSGRQRILIPMVRAEIKRRELVRLSTQSQELVQSI